MKKIGLDGDQVYSRVVIRSRNYESFQKYADPINWPWLDVGTGGSWLRDQFSAISLEKFGQEVLTSNIDLDIDPYPFPDAHFQTITSFEIIEHLYNPLFHLSEINRVLSREGRLYLTTPNDLSLIHKAEHLLSRKYRPHFHQFSERDLRDILDRANLRVYSLKKIFRSKSGTIARISRNGFFVSAGRK